MALRLCLVFLLLASFAMAEEYPVILKGKVTMPDGSPPPKSVGIQRTCSDGQGSQPGPLTDKKGEYLWRMMVDPLRTRTCRLEVTSPGFVSNAIDISGLNGYTETVQTMPTIVLQSAVPNPMAIASSEKDVPAKATKDWRAAMKGIDDGNLSESISALQRAVAGSPKFALGWHTLGILYLNIQKTADAKDAWQHAIEADPKAIQPRVAYVRVLIKTHDWDSAVTAAQEVMKADPKRTYPEVFLHLAVAKYGLKDYDGAQAAMADVMKYNAVAKRAEYVMGRILEAKGDVAGAKEHISKYIAADPNVADIETIKAQLALIGMPGEPQPDLELL